ncbi:MAG: MATE family efflux transporter [Succinivibrio sp.]
MEDRRDLVHGPILQRMLFFALPLAFTSVLQQLYNTADVVIAGRFEGAGAMAAIGSNIAVISLLVALFLGLSIGSNVVVARYVGMGDRKGAAQAASLSLWFPIASGAAVALPCMLLADPLLRAMDVPGGIAQSAREYLLWYLAGMPFLSLFNFEAALFRAIGDSATPLKALLCAGIFNIAADLASAGPLGLGISGIAASTSLANALGSLLLLRAMARSEGPLADAVRMRPCLDGGKLRAVVFIGLPAGVQGMVFSVSNIVLQSAVNSLGGDVMAGVAAAFTVEFNAYSFISAFGLAVTTFVGQARGAGSNDRARQAVRAALAECFGAWLVLCAAVLPFGPFMLSSMTGDPQVIADAMERLWWIIPGYALSVPMEVLSGALRGCGWSLPPALATLACVVGSRMFWIFTVFSSHPLYDVMLAIYPISWALTLPFIIGIYLRSPLLRDGRAGEPSGQPQPAAPGAAH